MEQKIFRAPIELKQDGEEGEFTAVFATFGVVDHHGDVTVPGAFKEQPVAVEPWNHAWSLPAGKGVIKSDKERAWIDGRFFLDTEAGRENYATVKNLGELAEWSYSFNIEQAEQGDHEGNQVRVLRKLDVVGVGPVTRGAGIDTRTVAIKEKGEQPQPAADNKAAGGEGEAKSGKPSGADLLTRINIVEADVIRQRIRK